MPAPSTSRRRRVLLNRGPTERSAEPARPRPQAQPAPDAAPPVPPRTAEPTRERADPRTAWLPWSGWSRGEPAVRPKLVVIDTRTGERRPIGFGGPQVTLGSDDALHMTLPDLAPRHAAVQAVPGGVLVFAAVTGGLERAGAATDAVLLRAGGTVRLGPYELEVRRVAPLPGGLPKPRLHRYLPAANARLPEADDGGVTVSCRGATARLSPACPVLTVGSHRRAAVRLGDAAPLAALLLFTSAGPAAVDLRSPQRLTRNGAPARRPTLTPGDRLTIGGSPLKVSD